jgi:hypothetical protein
MAYVSTAAERHDFAPADVKLEKTGLLARLFAAVVASRQLAAEREIRNYLEGSGRFLTDEAEREIERILSARGGL